jgi:GNAT superfamily N-acetyltransferase
MPASFAIRPASLADIDLIARHRAEMFTEMRLLPSQLRSDLVSRTLDYLGQAIPAGEYVGWMASAVDRPDVVVAGAGVQRRRILPHPLIVDERPSVAHGHQAIVLNVFTERSWRRRGLAAMLMHHVIDWARSSHIETLVLHASDDGRPLYEKLGFTQTSEMRYGRSLQESDIRNQDSGLV